MLCTIVNISAQEVAGGISRLEFSHAYGCESECVCESLVFPSLPKHMREVVLVVQ